MQSAFNHPVAALSLRKPAAIHLLQRETADQDIYIFFFFLSLSSSVFFIFLRKHGAGRLYGPTKNTIRNGLPFFQLLLDFLFIVLSLFLNSNAFILCWSIENVRYILSSWT